MMQALLDFTAPELLPTVAPHVRGSETSRAAAEAIRPHLGRAQKAVLRWLAGQPFPRDDNAIIDAMEALGWSRNGPRARRIELERAGLIRKAGTVNKCSVWVVTDAGRTWLEEDQ